MADLCPHCYAEPMPTEEKDTRIWECCTIQVFTNTPNRTDRCRIRELQQQVEDYKTAAEVEGDEADLQREINARLEKENSELHAHYTHSPSAYSDSYFDIDLNGTDEQKLRTIRAWMKVYCKWRSQSPSTSLGKEVEVLCGEMDELEKRIAQLEALMQEAFENCETCRGETGSRRCARCITFRKALDKEPGDE